jgi:hypothetical protein
MTAYPLSAAHPTSVVVTEEAVYVASLEGVACLRNPTGELLWSKTTRATGRPTLLLAGDRLFVAKSGEVECFTLSGESLWHDA